MKMAGCIELMCRSSNPKTRAHGLGVKARLEEEYRRDVERWKRSPGYRLGGGRVVEAKGEG